jgi:hypothetical protein
MSEFAGAILVCFSDGRLQRTIGRSLALRSGGRSADQAGAIPVLAEPTAKICMASVITASSLGSLTPGLGVGAGPETYPHSNTADVEKTGSTHLDEALYFYLSGVSNGDKGQQKPDCV